MPGSETGLPVGAAVADWRGAALPDGRRLDGRLCRLERLAMERHASDLFRAWRADAEGRNWTYLAYGPFADEAALVAFYGDMAARTDPLFYAIVDQLSGVALGVASFLRMDPAHGVVEVGHISYGPALQRSPLATEAMYLMMRHAFDDLGNRRYEWKCDDRNGPSRRAALRLGFTYEGTFRQAMVYKGRNRDTAWFSVLDSEWPRLKAAFEAWLDPANFDAAGQQIRRLEDLRAA
ncbi:GNAT family N-acetyltransferase [Microvirga tunisiensis]|uniref:GNAT family N-acetyltransferase n=1 Tax=Pannonibacter tanglangensis TaxID=2750084 RepID=A0A7X5EZD5_9HYPH|nr:GNAT family protein [Pannonibacter sp. XCT-53]NBN76923.1 GNAT family N-acetyltransferase [Pannonibacter sp. XCT-53]